MRAQSYMTKRPNRLLQFLKSESVRTLALSCTALAAMVMGVYYGLFVVLWIEWAAILGGLLLAGTVFLFGASWTSVQCLRVLLFVAGLALAGAGTTDILNFPESNSDVLPGALAGIIAGLILARVIWGAGLRISDRGIFERFDLDGIGIASLIPLMGIALLALTNGVLKDTIGTYKDIVDPTLIIAVLLWQHWWIKRRGDGLSKPAVWVTFLSMLIYSTALLIYWGVWASMSVEGLVVLFVINGVVLVLWIQRFVHTSEVSPDSSDFAIRTLRLITNSASLVSVLLLFVLYYLTMSQLVNNAIPTALVADNEVLFKMSDEKFVRMMMYDIYYAHPLQNVFKGEKDTPATFMEKFSTDPWSFARTYERENELEEGFSVGRGITPVIHSDKKIIGYINHDSPAARAGYERGDEIIRYFDGEIGHTQIFIRKPSGTLIANTIKPERHQVDTVMYKVIQQDGENIGYLWLMDFNTAAVEPMRNAFREFKQKGITVIVLDLRYNGGGHADPLLASLIAGVDHAGQVYYRNKHSEKYRDRDEDHMLSREPNSIRTKRLFVLTTNDTCSASELIINGLRPYLPVITIGDTTCGKPYFMYPIGYGGFVYFPVSGRTYNAEGRSDYESGIKPTCKVEETFDHQVDQLGDALLDAALYYEKNNACPG